MISRRILRIKVLQTVYSFYQSGGSDFTKSEKELSYSIQKTYDLYFYLILLIAEVRRYALEVIERNKQKLLATEKDLDPKMKFVNNSFIEQISQNSDFLSRINSQKISWINYPELVKKIFTDLEQTPEYAAYMSENKNSYDSDKKIVAFMLENVIYDCEEFYKTLEKMSAYWVDCAEFIIGMVLKTIERYKVGFDESYPLPKMYKNDDDREFVRELFRKTIAKGDYYRELISKNTSNWDIERIAFVDILILQTALAEVETFPEIPLKVTFNEYIELAKNYSTAKSSIFVNGVLDKIVSELISEKKINKIAEMPSQTE